MVCVLSLGKACIAILTGVTQPLFFALQWVDIYVILFWGSDVRVPRKCSVRRTASVWQVKYNICHPVRRLHRPSAMVGRLFEP